MKNKYSVLLSVYYKETPENLDKSIYCMVNQTIPPNEFIIVKDGPLTNALETVLQKYDVAYPGLFNFIKNEKNIGLGLSMAKGVLASKNELIARMDSDDWSSLDRCEKQLEMFKKYPEIGMVGSNVTEFINDIDNTVAYHNVPETNEEIIKFMRKRIALIHPTVIFKRSLVLKSGNYKSVLLYEDYDLFARMIFEHKVKCYNIQEPLYAVRVSEDFFNRRGGTKYARTVLKFKWSMYKRGYMSLIDYIISGIGQALVCIMPNGLRELFYKKLLRRQLT